MNEATKDQTLSRGGSCCGSTPAPREASASDTSPPSAPCCSEAPAAPGQQIQPGTTAEDIRKLVREKYGDIARAESPSCSGTGVVENPEHLGYSAAQAAAIPEGANLGLGCGNPLQHARVQVGETVLDLGSGAGIDAFLAARAVGPSGRVIGVDMTPEMIERARSNARKVGAPNVEFRLGEIEHLPVPDASVDLIISNCVINLSPDKPQVFREALRALRPGGRLVVSDLVLLRPLPEALRASVSAYVGCIAGASLRDEYLQHMRDAGFTHVEVVEETGYAGLDMEAPAELRGISDTVVSVKVRAYKR